MESVESERTFFTELEARRNRSAFLAERAAALGLVAPAAPERPAPESPADREDAALEANMPPAFADPAETFAPAEPGYFDEIDLSPSPSSSPMPSPDNEDPPRPELSAVDASAEIAADKIESAAADAFAEASEDLATEPPIPMSAAPAADAAPRQANAPSESALPEEPEMLEEVERALAAEIIAERIGQVVDIQRFPKTKPMRVLSKTQQAKAKPAPPTAQPPPKSSSSSPFAADAPMPSDAALDAAKTDGKAKKKRVSLLDSYFRGL